MLEIITATVALAGTLASASLAVVESKRLSIAVVASSRILFDIHTNTDWASTWNPHIYVENVASTLQATAIGFLGANIAVGSGNSH